ncbi:MAG: penicillin-binding protein 1C [Rhizobiaceae bacterium]
MKNRILKSCAWLGLGGALIFLFGFFSFLAFDRYYPPILPEELAVSTQVVDRDGRLLKAFATEEGRWRLPADLERTDGQYIKLLLAYEDKRFYAHRGVDLLAMVRAFGQLVSNGKIISGGSTITMQLARLLEPRKQRSLKSKLVQMVRAIQLELRLSKAEILQSYLTLAPYGGNLEGVRAASLAYFGKEPSRLSLSQSALLVALPQSPETRRPDRFNRRSESARNTVLKRMAKLGVIALVEVERASRLSVSKKRRALPYLAAHMAQRAVSLDPQVKRHQVTLSWNAQQALEKVALDAARKLPPRTSIAMVFADAITGDVLVEIGSPNYLDSSRNGWLDMTRAIRSPGSTLKPFIYGLAFEEGVVSPQTIITDAPSDFSGYRPQNFDMNYQGDVSVRKALQLSLNVPAVHLLEAVGPARLLSRFKRAGVTTIIPKSERPGLAIGLGGMGISLRNLTQLYTGLVNGGRVTKLRDGLGGKTEGEGLQNVLLQPSSTWQVVDILADVRPPKGSRGSGIAYKTGTSYGYRDAWSVGFDGKYVLGVWVGRPDNGSVPGITGYKTAAPILFEAFNRTGLKRVAFASAPLGTARVAQIDLPVMMRRFRNEIQMVAEGGVPESGPKIVYPPEGATVELAKTMSGETMPVMIKMQDGRPPFRWLANGKLLPSRSRKRTATWLPDGGGFSTLTVIDAVGRAASVNLYLKTQVE